MRFIVCVIAMALTVSGNPVDSNKKPQYDLNDAPALFEQFIKDYNRQYKDAADRKEHYEAFCNTLKSVNELNANPDDTATYGINNLSDYTEKERKNLYGFGTH